MIVDGKEDGKLHLDPPIMNGCGILSYPDVFAQLEAHGAEFGAWIPKSFGPEPKLGNPNPTLYAGGPVCMNSFALPTHSLESWKAELDAVDLQRPLICSVYGKKPYDYSHIVEEMDGYAVAWEVNVSCPNKEVGESSLQERMMLDDITYGVRAVREATRKPVIVKISPNENVKVITRIAADEGADYITCGNTLGPGLAIDIYSRRPILAGRFGGISGPALKPVALRVVNEVYTTLNDEGHKNVGVIASGGISTWEDIIEFTMAGARHYQIGTELMGKKTHEIASFSKRIWQDVLAFLVAQDTTLDELVGSLER